MSCIWHYYKGAHILIQLIVIIFVVFHHRVHEFPDNRMPPRSCPTVSWKKHDHSPLVTSSYQLFPRPGPLARPMGSFPCHSRSNIRHWGSWLQNSRDGDGRVQRVRILYSSLEDSSGKAIQWGCWQPHRRMRSRVFWPLYCQRCIHKAALGSAGLLIPGERVGGLLGLTRVGH